MAPVPADGVPVARKTEHFTDLDGLRGLLALAVVLFHYGINALVSRATHGLVPGLALDLSVDFFFILSGFVLTHSLHGRPVAPVRFAIKRLWRLLPAYYATLLMMLLAVVASDPAQPFGHRDVSLPTIALNLLLAAPLVGAESLNFPAWSITWELYLPILAVAAAGWAGPLLRRWSLPALMLLGCALSATSYAVADSGRLYGLRAALGLLAGASLYLVQDRSFAAQFRARTSLLYPLVLALLAVMAGAVALPLIALAFPWLAFAIVTIGSRTRSILSSPPIALLGRLSYTLYLAHIPVLAAVIAIAGEVSGNVLLKGLALLLTLGVAYLLSVTVEKWGMDRGRRRGTSDPAKRAAGGRQPNA